MIESGMEAIYFASEPGHSDFTCYVDEVNGQSAKVREVIKGYGWVVPLTSLAPYPLVGVAWGSLVAAGESVQLRAGGSERVVVERAGIVLAVWGGWDMTVH